MRHQSLAPDPRERGRARGDLVTLQAIEDIYRRAMAQAMIDAIAKARELEQLDPDKVAESLQQYLGPEGPWTDHVSDALWAFRNTCFDLSAQRIGKPEES